MQERERNPNGTYKPIHGKRNSRLYKVWCAMKRRCNSPHDEFYSRYGERGIKVCGQWDESFESFYGWAMKNGYKEGLSIDRIDNEKGYEPENCRWTTPSQQNRNYSRNHFITYKGETKCLADWAKEFGINRATVLWRIKAGKPLDEVFKKEDGRAKRWTTNQCSIS